MLLNLDGFQYATSLNLNKGCYNINIIDQDINLCDIILPWGKYRCKCLPMGASNSPDIFQEKTNRMFHGFDFTQSYIDDLLLITKGDWSDHLENLELTLQKLQGNGIHCNIEKSFFGQTDNEYLDFWVTWPGIRLIDKKVKSIVTKALRQRT